MNRISIAILLTFATACTQSMNGDDEPSQSTQPLSKLASSGVAFTGSDDGLATRINVGVATPDCDWFADDVVATFAGATLGLDQPFTDLFGACVLGGFESLGIIDDAAVTASSTVTVSDPSASWTITPPPFSSSALTVSAFTVGQNATVTWTDGPLLATACITLSDAAKTTTYRVCLGDDNVALVPGTPNAVAFPIAPAAAGLTNLQVEVSSGNLPSSAGTCIGPQECTFMLSLARTFNVLVGAGS